MTLISGWGGYPVEDAQIEWPRSASDCRALLGAPLIARGRGRSYGDSANAARVLQTRHLDHFLAFDSQTGSLTAQAGVTIREILSLVVPAGWFLPVVPGTSHVTLGGAIASDVHGKNHHGAGTFGQHVESLRLMLGTGDEVTASPTQRPDLFHATCGGMGLTGVILQATLRLKRLPSSQLMQTTLKARCLEQALEQFEAHSQATYAVAWIDCLSTGPDLGRSVLMLAEHADEGPLEYVPKRMGSAPVHAPAALLNPLTMRAFNTAYYARARHGSVRSASLSSFFFPLDAIDDWNRLYGRPGFVQYQFVVPRERGAAHMRLILERIARSGLGSFLAVLKEFGSGNDHLLSFPMRGYTLALDFKMRPGVIELLRALDDMVVGTGGRVYLTKDAVMREASFKAGYPRWREFESVRHRYGAIGRFASSQSRRLGLS